MRKQCIALNIDPERLAPSGPPPSDVHWEVWPEHWLAVQVFAACRTQWHTVQGLGGGAVTGLDYQALDVVMRRMRVPRRREAEVFAQVQVMETEGLKVLNKD